MNQNHQAFGDVELMLLEHLDAPDRHLCTATPPNMSSVLSDQLVIRVNRIGGGDDGTTSDQPRVRVDVFALASSDTPRAAHDGASAIRTQLRNLPARTSHGTLAKLKSTESGPAEMPWSEQSIVRVQQIFRLSTR